MCIYKSVESHILIDGSGFFALESGFETAGPERFVDTRDTARAAINVTAIRPNIDAATGFAVNGFVSITPGSCSGSEAPDTSSLNMSRGDLVRANGAVVSLADSDAVCVYTSTERVWPHEVLRTLPICRNLAGT